MYSNSKRARKCGVGLGFLIIISMLLTMFQGGIVAAGSDPPGQANEYVVYVDGVGSGNKDGSSPENAFQYITEAYDVFADTMTGDETAVIVVCGDVSVSGDVGLNHLSGKQYALPRHNGLVVITSKHGEEDFTDIASIGFGGSDVLTLHLSGNTRFENIRVSSLLERLYCGYHSIHMGQGIESDGIAIKFIYGGTNSTVGTQTPVGDTSITIESGVYREIYGGGFSHQGTNTRAKDYDTNIIINGGTIEFLYGTGNGTTDYVHQKNVHITINGGNISSVYGVHGDANVYGDVEILFNEDVAEINSIYGAADGANVLGQRVVTLKNFGSANEYVVLNIYAENIDTLGLASSYLIITDENEDLWNTLSGLNMTDDSRLRIDFIPESAEPVGLSIINTGEEYLFDTVLINAPFGTGNLFILQYPLIHALEYDPGTEGTDAVWKLVEGEIPIGEKGIDGQPMNVDLGLPESYNAIIDGETTYERFLQRLEELGDASVSARVIEPIPVQGEIEIYVAPDGDDNNNGTKNSPLKTIQKALDYVQSIQENIHVKGIVVYLREGTYPVPEPVILGEQHSGTEEAPVIISAYNNEEVKLSGGVDIDYTEFKPVTDQSVLERLQPGVRDEILVADLNALGITEYGTILNGAEGGPTYQLIMNGEAMTLARYPNATKLELGEVLDVGPVTAHGSIYPYGYNSESTGIEFVMQDLRPMQWENTGHIWLKGALYAEYNTQNIRVAEIRKNVPSIKLDGGCGYGAVSGGTYYYYNILEELDSPGEYLLDSENGLLYIYPIADMSESRITLCASNNDILVLSGTRNVVINGLTIENGGRHGIVMDSNCYKTVIQNCIIQNVSTTGLVLDGRKSGIIYSTIRYIGNHPIRTVNNSGYFNYTPTNNFIQNCYIHNTGQINPKFSFITMNGIGDVISHNLIQGTFSVAIYNQNGKECIVEYNEIVGGPTGTYDCGAIYSIGFPTVRGNHYRYNYIHDVFITTDNTTNPHGIYIDEMSSESYVYGNVMENIPSGFFANSGSQHVVINNVVMDGRTGSAGSIRGHSNFENNTIPQRLDKSSLFRNSVQVYGSLSSNEKDAIRRRNPSLCEYLDQVLEVLAEREQLGDAYVITDKEKVLLKASENYFVGNISYNHKGIEARGGNNVTAPNLITDEDPFVDYQNGDYRLKEGVNVEFDYVPIPFGDIGITGTKHGIDEFALYNPVNGSQGRIYCNEVLLKWTTAGGADYYLVTIATDEGLTQNVRTIKTESSYCYFENDEYFDYGSTYYWTVEAYTTANSRVKTPVSAGQIFSFRTMTVEEYLAISKANTTQLAVAIARAQVIADSIVEGSAPGQYEAGTKAALTAAIQEAETVMAEADNKVQEEVDAATVLLNQAVLNAIAKQNIEHITFDDPAADDWSETTDATPPRMSISVEEGELLMTVNGNRSEAIYKDIIGLRQMLKFDFCLETLEQWNGFAIRQSNKDVFVTTTSSTDSYFICIKPDQFELQKRAGGTNYGNINVVSNNQIMTSGQWYTIELGAVNQADGSVRILFKVNDTVVFDYLDETNTISEAGYFGVIVQQANGNTRLRAADLDAPVDPGVPELTVNQGSGTVNEELFTVSGTVNNADKVTVKVNDGEEQEVPISGGVFSTTVILVEGENSIVVKAENTDSGEIVTEVLQINYEAIVTDPEYTLTIGSEQDGGVGKTRVIAIGGTGSDDLDGKYLVVQFTEGTGEAAKVAVVMISPNNNNITVSYQVSGTKVDAWLTSGMPDLAGEDMGVTIYVHASGE